MKNALQDTAMTAGNLLYGDPPKPSQGSRVAELLAAPDTPETNAAAAYLIGLAIALNNPGKGTIRQNIPKEVTPETLRQTSPSDPAVRPRPVQELAAELLDAANNGPENPRRNALLYEIASIAKNHVGQANAPLELLTPDRREKGAYYTAPPTATLMARLCVPENWEWSKPRTLRSLKIADYACGAGALLAAAYRRVRELHRQAGGQPAKLHRRMMSHCLTGTDISPAAAALTVETLARIEPGEKFDHTRIARIPYGPAGPDRKPALGALNMLTIAGTNPTGARAIRAGRRGKPLLLPADARTRDSQDIVIMNPPFSRPFNYEALDQNAGARQENKSTPEEIEALKQKTAEIIRELGADLQIGAAYPMAMLALRNTAPGGRCCLIHPATALTGGGGGRAISQNQRRIDGKGPGWRNFRMALLNGWNEIKVLTTATYRNQGNNFSGGGNIAEVLITARKLMPGEQPKHVVKFVNLNGPPAKDDEAEQLADAINHATDIIRAGQTLEVRPKNGPQGYATALGQIPGEPWNAARKLDPSLAEAARAMTMGKLPDGLKLPLTSLGNIAEIGVNSTPKEPRRIGKGHQPAPDEEWLIQYRDARRDTSMKARPLDHAAKDPNVKHQESKRVPVARLHVSSSIRYNSQPTAACLTAKPALGGYGWPAAEVSNSDSEKALALWLNSTPGLICLWYQANQTQNGIGFLSNIQLRELPVINAKKLAAAQIKAMNRIFDDLDERKMLPASEAWQDPARMELDRRLLKEALGADDETLNALNKLRTKWCLEPTVQARKGYTKPQAENMERLRAAAQASERPARPRDCQETVSIHVDCLRALQFGQIQEMCRDCQDKAGI